MNISEVRNITENLFVSDDRQQLAYYLLQNHGTELHGYGYAVLAIYKIIPTNKTEVNVSTGKSPYQRVIHSTTYRGYVKAKHNVIFV
jgi:Zn-dependent M28 family amino/carboxypeptidase